MRGLKVSRKDEIDIVPKRIMLFHKDFQGEQITGFFKPAIFANRNVIRMPDGSINECEASWRKGFGPHQR